jgi:hypothetical protein
MMALPAPDRPVKRPAIVGAMRRARKTPPSGIYIEEVVDEWGVVVYFDIWMFELDKVVGIEGC